MSEATTDVYHGTRLIYAVDLERWPESLASRHVRLCLDDETRAFVAGAGRTRSGVLKTLGHRLLRPFLSDFDINGLLGTYPLFCLSRAQWRQLLPGAGGRLLDVGAGNGDVTARLADDRFDEVAVTETSRAMARSLTRRGYRCHRIDLADHEVPAPPYDVISCLNVLDRCDRPRTLLERAASALNHRGRLVVATPLPLNPFVYEGGSTREPEERLVCPDRSWHDAASSLYRHELAPLGLSLASVSRAPYLSAGDSRRPLYVLDDAIFVLRRV